MTIATTEYEDTEEVLGWTSEIVSAYAGRNQMSQDDLINLIRSVHGTLTGLSTGEADSAESEAPEAAPAPAVPIDASVTKDAVVCLECGKSFKTLKRHLSTEHALTPADYKARWQLSKDYPLVAPSYSKRRAATAKKIGLGRKPKAA